MNNVNMSKKDLINAKNASLSVKTAIDNNEICTVSGCAIVENGGTNKNGETCNVGYIATDKGVFGFTSAVLLRSLNDFADYLADCLESGEEVKIKFFAGKTVKGAEFYNFTIV